MIYRNSLRPIYLTWTWRHSSTFSDTFAFIGEIVIRARSCPSYFYDPGTGRVSCCRCRWFHSLRPGTNMVFFFCNGLSSSTSASLLILVDLDSSRHFPKTCPFPKLVIIIVVPWSKLSTNPSNSPNSPELDSSDHHHLSHRPFKSFYRTCHKRPLSRLKRNVWLPFYYITDCDTHHLP